MASISELRQGAKITKEIQNLNAKRIQEAVKDVVTGDPFTLTILNQMGSKDTESQSGNLETELASHIANKVAERVNDPVNEFLDICKSRGLEERKIKKAVRTIDDLFGLTPGGAEAATYEDSLLNVAEFMRENKQLYDDIAMLTN